MIERASATARGRLLAALRVQYPDVLGGAGFRPLHPVTGEPCADGRRHLVATCRSVANFAAGAVAGGPDWCVDAAERGIDFLESAHRADAGGYRLVVDADGDPVDRTRSAYGHAFVLLAYARATAAGVDGAEAGLEATAALLEERFHDGTGRLRSDCDPDWTEREPYRGQNANMHACEAYLAAHEATGDRRYLERARRVARGITVDLAAETDGLLWEHYTEGWDHDFAYNADAPRHRFRPPGYQPGHHAEWATLLALLDRYDAGCAPAGGWASRAAELFAAAVDLGWTGDGFVYTVEADGDVLVPDRYGWALAEGIGAAAALAERADAGRVDPDAVEAAAVGHGTVDAGNDPVAVDVDRFDRWHGRLVDLADDYRGPAGVWYEKRLAPAAGGDPVAPEPPAVEPDYHPVSAFLESWRSGRLREARRE
ncbi:AGE family epimerase/isomerase [Halorubrum rubrum]|uniref:AGE family epimerase/isomerase n=1 Tax=Halorubrum rubrum TaxID=1126240 RepID=A0ABD5R1L2_9EURY|nr:AGE family epimerase/isomerase [Halorubrum rubrum]